MRPGTHFALVGLTLHLPRSDRVLIKELNLVLKPGDALLVTGASGCGKSSLLRAIAGLWNTGSGTIQHPRWKTCSSSRSSLICSKARCAASSSIRACTPSSATSALDSINEASLYARLRASGATLVSIAHREAVLRHHTHVLKLTGDGTWKVHEASGFQFDESAADNAPGPAWSSVIATLVG